jgi:hypothetical protein
MVVSGYATSLNKTSDYSVLVTSSGKMWLVTDTTSKRRLTFERGHTGARRQRRSSGRAGRVCGRGRLIAASIVWVIFKEEVIEPAPSG